VGTSSLLACQKALLPRGRNHGSEPPSKPARLSATKGTKRPLGHAKGETLGEAIRAIRSDLGETQLVFASRFNRSRNYITNTERGELHTPEFVQEVIREFPDQKTRLRRALKESLSRREPRVARRRPTRLQAQVEKYLRTGRFSYAHRRLMQELATTDDAVERQWMYERLHAALTGLGQQDAGLSALQHAVDAAIDAGLHGAETTCRVRLANRYQIAAEFHRAHEILDAGLRRHPRAASLWLQKGKVHWYEQAYSDAYSTLTTALQNDRTRRSSVLHARSQVLAEWGSFSAALTDIANYLALDHGNPASVASVRSARAYVWGMTDDLDSALVEFKTITPLNPDSAWLYYRRALCYSHAGDERAAATDLKNAIRLESPKLNPPRLAHAKRLLGECEPS
jgi:tetratricopeptide (TPR) repeat protein